jgi:phosphate:Na+ symporter
LLVGFARYVVKLAEKMVKQHDDEDVEYRLQHISIGLLSTAELSLLQAKKEIIIYAKRTYRMYGFVKDLFKETNEGNFQTTFDRIEKYENISDRVELEIATYLTQLTSSDLSEESSKRLQAMFRIISEIESISDSNYTFARILRRKKAGNIWFNQEVRDNINHILSLVDEALVVMIENLQAGYTQINLGPAYEVEEKINQYRNKLRDEHINNVEANRYKYQAGVIYNDLFSEAEKMGDYIINVSESIAEINKPLKKPSIKLN